MDNLLERARRHIARHAMLRPGQPVLAAVSGGADSMALLDILLALRYRVAVAHCNFNLRPGDCDQDQLLVEDFCRGCGVACHVMSFDTLAEARRRRVSAEMAARDLRYAWFERLAAELRIDRIATAHHLNDKAETLLLNIARGAGMAGLQGIRPVNGSRVRPLLFASRADIEKYAAERQIPYRHDITNADVSIPRNRVRHRVLPELQAINPGLLTTLQRDIDIWGLWRDAAGELLSREAARLVAVSDGSLFVRTAADVSDAVWQLAVYERLVADGLAPRHAAQVVRLRGAQTGTVATVGSATVTAERDGLRVALQRAESVLPEVYSFPAADFDTASNGFGIAARTFARDAAQPIPRGRDRIWADADKIALPLELRPWRPADRLQCYGGGSKKVSDLLCDAKVPAARKPRWPVVADRRGLLWVAGLRADRRYAIDSDTKRVVEIWRESES